MSSKWYLCSVCVKVLTLFLIPSEMQQLLNVASGLHSVVYQCYDPNQQHMDFCKKSMFLYLFFL